MVATSGELLFYYYYLFVIIFRVHNNKIINLLLKLKNFFLPLPCFMASLGEILRGFRDGP